MILLMHFDDLCILTSVRSLQLPVFFVGEGCILLEVLIVLT